MLDDGAPQIGLKDQPIKDRGEESLGLGEYAEALTEFVRRCDTPLTIALQGDWGSGKTSLMTLIMNDLEADERFHTVWFNTWQYAQFNMERSLALSMMSKIAGDLALDSGDDRLKSLRQGLWKAARMVAIGGASFVGQADTVKELANEAERPGGAMDPEDAAAALGAIKDDLTKIVQERTSGTTEKVVMFIDDLDRLVPERAVELLEAMKIFLDIDRCVYVLACDYGVVATGLEAKFGLSEENLGKSFFDKIIQVPFKMPTRRYQVNDYIRRLLEQIGIKVDSKGDVDRYSRLVEHSVGFNPRTMKRLLNTLQLLTILEDKRHEHKPADAEYRAHAARVTFAILCMLESYEPIYDHLTSQELSPERLLSLQGGLAQGEDFANLRRQIARGTAPATGDDDGSNRRIADAVEFVEAFVDCLQLDADEDLSGAEMGLLEDMLSRSTLVSVGRQQEFLPHEFAIALRRDLNARYRSFTQGHDKFRKEQGTVWLVLPGDGYEWLLMGRDDGGYYLDIRSYGRTRVPALGDLICDRLGWEHGEKLDEHSYRFFSQPATDRNAEDSYRSELCNRLDDLTEPHTKLSELCEGGDC